MNSLGAVLTLLLALTALPYVGLGLIVLDLLRRLAVGRLGWRLGRPGPSRLRTVGIVCFVVGVVIFLVTGFRPWLPFVGWGYW